MTAIQPIGRAALEPSLASNEIRLGDIVDLAGAGRAKVIGIATDLMSDSEHALCHFDDGERREWVPVTSLKPIVLQAA